MLKQHDARQRTVTWTCSACRHDVVVPYGEARLVALHPTNRSKWSLSLGHCPSCAQRGIITAHFVTCNLPVDHPHYAFVEGVIRALGQPTGG